MALDQRARRRLIQPPPYPVQIQIGVGQPHRDHRRQRHGKPLGVAAKPGTQQFAQFVVAERSSRGDAGCGDQQCLNTLQTRAAALRRRFPRLRHLHGERRARPLLPMLRQ